MTKQKINNPVEDYLYQAWYIDTNIASCINELNAIRIKAYSAPTANYSDIVVMGGEQHSKTEDCALKVLEYEQKLKGLMEQYAKLKAEIQDAIEGVKDMRQRTILRLRFIERLSFRDIAICVAYSKSQVERIYQEALKSVKIA
jgi:DNA-directed RNA polymerase specialized sigma subunit